MNIRRWKSLARYLVSEHQSAFAKLLPSSADPVTAAPAVVAGLGSAEKAAAVNRGRRGRSAARDIAVPRQRTPNEAEPIAIIGMSGRFPMAEDLEAFWHNLAGERDCISEIPKERWDWEAIYGDPLKEANKTNIKWGGFIDGVDQFDPLFFGISPREAEFMDPQQRLLMAYVWKAIEDAGYSAKSLSGSSTAILVGTGTGEYSGLIAKARAATEGYTATGVVPSVGPNRMSYFLNFHGPSEPIETACSSSLVALHRAVQVLTNGDCEMAIAGGVNTLLSPEAYISFSKAGMLSVEGRCKTFSRHANGYVRGEGVGMLVLKKLGAAERDGDHIYGVILGTAENHGGRAQSLTAPNPTAQAELLKTAYRRAGVDPRTVSYIETHGTGTPLGDPIEINGLKSAFRDLSEGAAVDHAYCGLGSVKSNIGHLELAAGVAGVIKVLLQLRHKTLVKSLHSDELNPYIQLSGSPFYIMQQSQPWQALQDAQGRDLPRRAGVSSFGFGGVNAHVVIEEYVASSSSSRGVIEVSSRRPALVVLSGRTEDRLKERARQLVAALGSRPDGELADIAYTLQVGREAMEVRLGLVVGSVAELRSRLESYLSGEDGIADFYHGQVRREKDSLAVFAADEDMARTIAAWASKGKYGKLLDLWVKGLAFDWTTLYEPDARPRRISLPTYPFARERYWIPDNALEEFGGLKAAGPALRDAANAIPKHAYEIAWAGQELRTKDPLHASEPTRLGTHVLIPAWQAISRTDAILLPSSTDRTLVLIGEESIRSVCTDSYPTSIIQIFDTTQSTESWAAQVKQAVPFNKVAWFAPRSSISVDDDLIQLHQDNLNACIRFIKALLSLSLESLEVTFVTTEAQLVHDRQRLNLAQAGLHGIVGCLAKERPNWIVRVADFDRLDPTSLNECLCLPVDPVKHVWAYRGDQWLSPCLLPYKLEDTRETSFKPGGVYVLIGGAGKVGRTISEYLIQSYGAKIVWIGRRKGDGEIQSEIERLSRFGPAPIYISADARDLKDLSRARDEIRTLCQRIDGLFQTTAVLLGSNLIDLDEAQFHAGCSAKFDVGVRLFQVFGRDPLDFVIFFSSIQSFERMQRQSSYAAGCVSQDALAHALPQLWQCSVKVINWGYFGFRDNEEIPQSFRNWLKLAGVGVISLPEAIAFLEKALVGSESQIAIAHFTSERGAKQLDIRWDELASRLPSRIPHVATSSPRFSTPLNEDSLVAARQWQDEVGRILRKFIAWTLQAIGVTGDDGHSIASPIASSLHGPWIQASLGILRADRLVSDQHEQLAAVQAGPIDVEDLWREWNKRKAGWLANVDLSAELNLLEVCLRSLPDIISGRRKATDVLFPQSSISLVEPIYKNNWISNYFNRVLADRVAAYVSARVELNGNDKIRILEVGAGTGATSVEVIDRLAEWHRSIAEYKFSDVSKAFFEHARKKAGLDAAFVQYQVIDVERSFPDQSVEVGGYDIVIASNVLHATKDVRATLRHLKAAAKRGGILILNEVADKSLFAHVTFGLLTGWWAHEDSAVRIPESPVVLPEVWSRLLQEEGFHSVEFLASSARAFGQEVIVCESDGLIRLKTFARSQAAETKAVTPEPSISLNVTGGNLPPAALAKGHADEVAHDLFDFVQRTVGSLIADTLKLDARGLEIDQAFADYGLDSIMAIKTVEALNRKLSTELTTTSLFDYSSVGLLTKHIVEEFAPQVLQALGVDQRNEADEPLVSRHERAEESDVSSPLLARASRTDFKSPAAILDTVTAGREAASTRLAVVGLSCRYGRAGSAEEFWNYLASGSDLTEEVSRWDLAGLQLTNGAAYCNRGGFLRDIDCFDPLFFNISGAEASFMDPQHRIFLEESWKALEDAGYAGVATEGKRCGVYVGHNGSDYHSLFPDDPPPQAMWGNAASVLSARIAYYLNLRGPAVTIDTACSSSLVATHLACQALLNREIDFALAGGVFVQCTPSFYVMTSRSGMLSPTGRCHTFDNDADGFVPGEGVGVVLIKRLEDAQAAGDHIYGIICGSGINQDGATNGLTAPSAASQENLERTVYDRFGIRPEEIQMVEAHGTGTKLGDPIEWDALTRAFRGYTDKTKFCAIGSVKTNIGHTTAASGVGGLIKVLLSLQHRQIPPSLNYKQGNSFINFEDSPFFVNTVLRDWTTPDGQSRRAAISSFGMSGTNAHLVVEEAPTSVFQPQERGVFLIVLSAKSEWQLQQQARQLADFCRDNADTACNDISFTLLVGRRHFNFRLACVVRNTRELETVLRKWVTQENVSSVCVSGTVDVQRRGRKSLVQLGNQCVSAAAHDGELIRRIENLSSVAELFCVGCDLDYERLFSGSRCQRVSLPTYPFAKERYWVPMDGKANLGLLPSQGQHLHPLLHENTSDLSGQRFSSRFTGEEFFLSDHVVGGSRILPGVAYLEMVRAAIARSAAVGEGEEIRLRQVAWLRPIVVGADAVDVDVELLAAEDGGICFEIYSGSGDAQQLHSQGQVAVGPVAAGGSVVDLNALRAQCTRSVSANECYDAFSKVGIDYGPAHRGLAALYCGVDEQGQRQVLAELRLPSCVSGTADQYVLHPSLLDSALQASVGLSLGSQADQNRLLVPFAVEEVEVVKDCPAQVFAWLRWSAGSGEASAVSRVDIDICDDAGEVCVRLRGFSFREFESGVGAPSTLLFKPEWRTAGVEGGGEAGYWQHWVVFCAGGERTQRIEAELASVVPGARSVTVDGGVGIAARYEAACCGVLELVQEILRGRPQGEVLIQLVVELAEQEALFEGLSGLLKTARQENPKLLGQVIGFEAGESAGSVAGKLGENARSGGDQQVRYLGGERLVGGWSEMPVAEGTAALPWREGGVYLITGGAGGLGLIFAKEIAERVRSARLVLTGRSALSEEKQRQLGELEGLGAQVVYRQLDVADGVSVRGLLGWIAQEYGELHGILHSAGVIQDSFIVNKTSGEVGAVLSPKVAGIVNLDEASLEHGLDFMVLFGSGAGALGSVGQADYSAANAFLDVYATYRNALMAAGQRQGRTVSIGWPLWRGGGMKMEQAKERLLRGIGMTALESAAGIAALYAALASGQERVVVLSGEPRRLRAAMLEWTAPRSAAVPAAAQPPSGMGDVLEEKALHYFKKVLASIIKLPVHRVEGEAPLEQYGLDSVMAMQLTSALESSFGSLSKTLLFEYQTIQALTAHFIASHRDRLVSLLGVEDRGPLPAAVAASVEVGGAGGRRRHGRAAPLRQAGAAEPGPGALDVAIIGLSGRYPQAANVEEFWRNLREGRDCISEIPKERWDHRLYFDEDKNQPGKTNSKWGGFIDGVDQFDPLFFNISPREAEFMDPQERLFLQCVYEALEDAGHTRETLGQADGLGLGGNVGVYVGVMYEEYQLYGAQEQARGRPISLPGSASSIANRVSYFCNFHGASMAVDTMCSSSLTALHLACQSLQRGGCDLAIAGGVNVSIHPNKYLLLGLGKFVSSKGRCESFGEGGDGYVPGEGVGAVLLKPLSKAVSDGDHIYGVIKSTAVNHGGKTNGYTVPNPGAQASVIGRALKQAGINPRAMGYIEAHGTGTSLGDPIEIAGLTKAFREHTAERQFCAIGSAKSNIGHCESAAGIAGLTKVLLQLKHGQLVPSLHSQVLNPHIDFAHSPFVVQQGLSEWPRVVLEENGVRKEYPRLAGISSFGAGGSNAHVVIEEYVASSSSSRGVIEVSSRRPALVVLSGRTEDRLKERARQLVAALGSRSDGELADIAYTLQVGREAMEVRLGLVVGSVAELRSRLESYLSGEDGIADFYHGQVRREKDSLAVFAADEDMARAIAAWASKGKYGKLLDLWVKGLAFDWTTLYQPDARPRRISLPTYPFAKERYWIDAAKLDGFFAGAVAPPSLLASSKSTMLSSAPAVQHRSKRFLSKHWRLSEAPQPEFPTKNILILADEATRKLAVQLLDHFPASRIVDLSEISGLDDAEYHSCSGWIDLVGCGQSADSFAQWMPFLQKLIEARSKEAVTVLGVTRGLEAYQNEMMNLSGASRAGLYRLLRGEYGRLRSKHVDVDASSSDQDICTQILLEFSTGSDELEVCYRGGRRYYACLEEVTLADDGSSHVSAEKFPERHVLWITGGTRGIGYLCAQHFVRNHGVRRLVLTGREQFPPREEWDAYQEQTSSVADKIRSIRMLETKAQR